MITIYIKIDGEEEIDILVDTLPSRYDILTIHNIDDDCKHKIRVIDVEHVIEYNEGQHRVNVTCTHRYLIHCETIKE